ncbi:type II CAAX endopeptidase family protein [Iamia majanohamensis]|uniref:Type II CAAX endopeptidase family protein n=1 Tax=Iamia majanohamensis TaxID=467976 RepID=A0AAF0BWF0_9ACTN|nr:type II CAAX endopeptidase family protein [Iamia majanohamensis]WCO67988.1 type II CAAX endopeptidase family protein [Iamia majanohamensis]
MATTPESTGARPSRAAWGVREVVAAAVITLVVSTVLGSVLLTVVGEENGESASLVTVAFLQTTLWAGMAVSVAFVLRGRTASILQDLGLRFRLVDIPVGVALGVACQLVLVPIISSPWARLLGRSAEQLREPACQLAQKADDPFGVVMLFAITVVGAPFVEELFFRGFVQRGMTAGIGRNLGVVATALVFGTVHYQLLQLPALIAFGLVLGSITARAGRLGPAIVTHAAFNATTVVTLVILSSSVEDRCSSLLGTIS